MNIAIMGFRDKRHIIYSILKILTLLGRTAFITTNPCYKQLSEDYSSEFEIDDTDILILTENLYDAEDILELENYDFIIWDSITEIPEELTLSIIVDHPELYRTAFTELNVKPKLQYVAKEIKAQKGENAISFIKASEVEGILSKIETNKKWYPITGFTHNKSISEILSSATGISKSEIIHCLKDGKNN